MAARAGEPAQKTGDFRCDNCHEKVHVKKGDKIPRRPNCGNDTYDARTGEPATKG